MDFELFVKSYRRPWRCRMFGHAWVEVSEVYNRLGFSVHHRCKRCAMACFSPHGEVLS